MLEECIPYIAAKDTWAISGSDWGLNGGHDVMSQYSSKKKLLNDALWVKKLPYYIKTGVRNKDNLELLVSHAWISRYIDIKKASETFMFVWDRKQPKQFKDTQFYNIYGHTPTSYLSKGPDVEPPKPRWDNNSVNIDTGCTYALKGRGWLTGVFFPSLEVKQIKRIDHE